MSCFEAPGVASPGTSFTSLSVFSTQRCKARKPWQTPAGSVEDRPEHLDNVSMRKCSQRRRRKGHLDRGELENDRNVRRHFY